MLLTGMLKGKTSSSVLEPSVKSSLMSLYGMLWKEGCSGLSLNLIIGEFVTSRVCSFRTRCSAKISAILIDLSGGGAQWGHGITFWSGNIQIITIFVDFRILPSTPKAELKPYSAVFIMATQRLISGFPIKIITVIVIVSVHVWV